MLIDDNPKLELTDQDASHLVRVLCASAKKAVGGKVVPSAESRKVTLSKAQKVSWPFSIEYILLVLSLIRFARMLFFCGSAGNLRPQQK